MLFALSSKVCSQRRFFVVIVVIVVVVVVVVVVIVASTQGVRVTTIVWFQVRSFVTVFGVSLIKVHILCHEN